MDFNNSFIWGIIGISLFILEIFTGSLYLLFFGIAAIFLAIINLFINYLNFNNQIFIYTLISLIIIFIGKKIYNKKKLKYHIGQSKENIGSIGKISKKIEPNNIGEIYFTQGLMGSKSWQAISNEVIDIGQEAKIVSIEGNYLKVSKLKE